MAKKKIQAKTVNSIEEDIINPIKPTFSMEVFRAKQYLSAPEYVMYIAERALDCGLITDHEFKQTMAGFKRLGLSPFQTVQAFDTMIKKRWQDRDTENYYRSINREANERDSFFQQFNNKSLK